METIWEALGIAPTADRRQIKKAYARRLKLVHPEDDPVGFQRLREAYELALAVGDGTRFAPAPEPPSVPEIAPSAVDELMERVRAVYREDGLRGSTQAWNDILGDDALWSLDTRACFEAELFRFLTRFQRDPGDDVWRLLDEEFQWRAHAQSLYPRFRDPYEVDRVLDRIYRAFPRAGALQERPVELPGGRSLFEDTLLESGHDDLLERPVPFLGGLVERLLNRIELPGGELSWWWIIFIAFLSTRFWFPSASEPRVPPPPAPAEKLTRAELEAQAKLHPGSSFQLASLYWNDEPRNHDEAFFWFRSAALRGHVIAQKRVGDAYRDGWAVGGADLAEAAKWYRFAARKRYVPAQVQLGLLHHRGEGVERNDAEAFEWLRQAASEDDSQAQAWVGYFYEQGYGVEQDLEAAVRWYRTAADDSSWARANLARLYEQGRGVAADPAEAARLYLSVAATDSWARLQLARLYATGKGVERDESESVYWLMLARRDPDLAGRTESLASAARARLTAEELRAIDERVAAWSARP